MSDWSRMTNPAGASSMGAYGGMVANAQLPRPFENWYQDCYVTPEFLSDESVDIEAAWRDCAPPDALRGTITVDRIAVLTPDVHAGSLIRLRVFGTAMRTGRGVWTG